MIEQGNICNLSCECCPNRLKQRKRGQMTTIMFKDIVDQLLEHNEELKSERVALHGVGEPLLHPAIFTHLSYLQLKGFVNVDVITNGVLLSEENAKKLTEFSCISEVRVSLNSSRKEVMEKINTGSDFGKVVNNIKYLLSLDPSFNLVIQHMITRINEDETEQEFKDLLGSDKFSHKVKRLHTYHKQTAGNELSFPDPGQEACQFGATLDIHWDGDLVGCCADDTKSQIYGNVMDGIFSKKTQKRKRYLNHKLQERDLDDLPFCKQCLGL